MRTHNDMVRIATGTSQGGDAKCLRGIDGFFELNSITIWNASTIIVDDRLCFSGIAAA